MKLSFLAVLPAISLSSVLADTTISPTDKHAYGANLGWINLRPDQPASPEGILVSEFTLSGHAHSANWGWINFGDANPSDGVRHANDSNTDFGVNHDSAGNLSGLAWAANCGWINFGWASISDSDRPRIDLNTGAFNGFAYSANFGWINLGTGFLTTDTLHCEDSDDDGIADPWEWEHFSGLASADENTDSDGDGQLDLDEYLALTDPEDPADFFHIISATPDSPLTSTNVEFTSHPGRLYTIDQGGDLLALTDSGLGQFSPDPGTTTTRLVTTPGTAPHFFRVNSGKPLPNIPIVYVWDPAVAIDSSDLDSPTSIAIGSDDYPRIAYAPGGDVTLAIFDGTTWSDQLVDASVNVSDFLSLAIDGSGQPAIAYYDNSADDLHYASYNGTSWSSTPVDTTDDVGKYCSLSFGPGGNPAIAYFDDTNNDLKYASFNGSTWDLETVDSSGSVGRYCSLAFSPGGQPAISYEDSFLSYAIFNGTSWQITSNVDFFESNTCSDTSLAFNPLTGQPAITYREGTGGSRLNYVYFNGSLWLTKLVDNAGTVGEKNSLAFDPNGSPAVSYFDGTNKDLKFATFDGTTWTPETIDSDPVLVRGDNTSLAFLPNGQPAISYWDLSNRDLKYATKVPDPSP